MRLVVDCPTLSRPAAVDRGMWEKIVLNLVSNAFKFTRQGEISVSLREVDNVAELSVRDTGVGIPEEELPRLFERFHQVPYVSGRSLEGTGIGLALVQELVKLHGGSVRVESTLGQGSTFKVTVPLDAATSAPCPAPAVPAPSPSDAGPYVAEATRWLPDLVQADGGYSLPSKEKCPLWRRSTRRKPRSRWRRERKCSWPTTTRTCGGTWAVCWRRPTTSRRVPTGMPRSRPPATARRTWCWPM